MFFLSKYPFKTLKTTPTGSDNRSTGLLLQAGFIRQEMAGVYKYLPFGLKVIQKISDIIRKEMNQTGAQELLLSSLGSRENWEKTERWSSIDVLFKVSAANKKEYALNCTHEESITPLVSEFIQSYRDLPVAAYQIQTKFRNEARAKSGLLRGREFLMKDLYSFHASDEDFQNYYELQKTAYTHIFLKTGIKKEDLFIALADGGDFTNKFSHEFQVKLDIGEDVIYICDKCGQAHNEEVIDPKNFVCHACGHTNYAHFSASEVGNIFPLETKFSQPFNVSYSDRNGKKQDVIMGCYGIGVSRLMGVIAEYFMDEKGLVWPENVAPFSHYLICHGTHNFEKAKKLAKCIESIYPGAEVCIDDRELGFGQKAKDADLLGIPEKIVISDKTIKKGGYEKTLRTSQETRFEIWNEI